MTSPVSSITSPSTQPPSTPPTSYFDLLDLDFSENTPPLSTTSSAFPSVHSVTSPANTPRSPPIKSGPWKEWTPMVPEKSIPKAKMASLADGMDEDEAVKAETVESTPTADKKAVADSPKEVVKEQREEQQEEVKEESEVVEEVTEQLEVKEEVKEEAKEEIKAAWDPASIKEFRPAPASDSGDSATAHLRAGAVPFKSNSLRVAPGSTPHSFFPDRADTNSHATLPLPTSPYAGTDDGETQSANGSSGFFYGESDGYAASGSIKVAPSWAHLSPPSVPTPSLSPVAAAAFRPAPEAKPIRISSPAQKTADEVPKGTTPQPSAPLVTELTPKHAPLPMSEPSSVESKAISLPATNGLALDLLSSDESNPSHENDTVNHLVRSMSNISLGDSVTEKVSSPPITEKLPSPQPIIEKVPSPQPPVVEASDLPQTTDLLPTPQASTEDVQMPSQQAQQSLEGLLESLEELDEMERVWAEYRDAYGKFSGGIEEVVARLKYNLDGHSCASRDKFDDLRAARQEIMSLQNQVRDLQSAKTSKDRSDKTKANDLAILQSQLEETTERCEILEKTAAEAQAQTELARAKLERLRDRYDHLEDDRVHWHKRESELAKSFLDLEDQYERTLVELSRLKKRIAVVEAAPVEAKAAAVFGAVLIECTASVIDVDFIKRGSAGGKELGENILAAVMPKEEGLVIAQIFLNFPEFKKKLIQNGVIKKEADLHDFLDGFRSISGLFTVVDTESPASKVQDHLKLYKLLGANKIVLASRRSSPYRDVISALPAVDKSAIFAVRGDAPEPFDSLGSKQLLSVPGLMKLDDQQTPPTPATPATPAVDQTPRALPPVRASPRPPTPPALPLAKPPFQRSRTPPHMRSSSSVSVTGSSNGGLSPSSTPQRPSIPPTPQSELPPAPWAQIPKAEPPKRPAAKISPAVSQKPGLNWWEKGDTMRDQAVSVAESDTSLSPPGTPRASARPLDSAQARTSRNGLTVPLNGISSPGGSPNTSDEGHPNVDLPHSAMKRVQRPIEFSQEPYGQSDSRSRSTSVSSSSIGVGSNRGPSSRVPSRAMALEQQGIVGSTPKRGSGGFRAPGAITGSNNIPLGQGGAASRLHGFNVQGRK